MEVYETHMSADGRIVRVPAGTYRNSRTGFTEAETEAVAAEQPNEPNADLAPRPILLYHPDTGGGFEAQNERQAQRMLDNGWKRHPWPAVSSSAIRRVVDPWQAGLDARNAGRSLADCPHADETWDHHAWMLGYARFPRADVRARHDVAGRTGRVLDMTFSDVWRRARPTKGSGAR